MASLRELVQTLLPGATPLVDAREEAMARSVTWVRLLRDRLPAFDGMEPGDLAIVPISTLRAVAGDIATGEAVVLGSGSLARALRASMSIPAALAPIEIDGRLLVDGGIAMNLPVEVAQAMGAEVVIADLERQRLEKGQHGKPDGHDDERCTEVADDLGHEFVPSFINAVRRIGCECGVQFSRDVFGNPVLGHEFGYCCLGVLHGVTLRRNGSTDTLGASELAVKGCARRQ